jgi:16S rRNA (cytosine967-C5)-methyltransferase
LKRVIREAGLDRREGALCSRICYGVQQNQLLLDFWMGQFSKVKVDKLESAVHTALAMGMYQAALMDRIPEHSAVSESVELVKQHSKNPNSPRLTNAILRTFCRSLDHLPQPESLSVKYSHPQWLVDLFSAELNGEGVEALLAADNDQPPTTVQVNPLKTTPEALLAHLRAQGVEAEPHPWAPGCLELRSTGDLEALSAFRNGEFLVQDAAARLARFVRSLTAETPNA